MRKKWKGREEKNIPRYVGKKDGKRAADSKIIELEV